MFTLNCKGRLLVVADPIVMGIINVTPDSFYSGSRMSSVDQALFLAEKMLSEGATILDIGGQSTRPGSKLLLKEEELTRVIPVIKAISEAFPDAYISIDTFYYQVAKEAIEAGASIINDISGGTMDVEMIPNAGSLRVPYIANHLKGTPANMQTLANYYDVTKEVLDFFVKKIEECRLAGILDVIIDPGFGFAKNIDHNFSLLKNLSTLKILQKPILAGLSRKSTVYKTLEITPEESLNGTTVLNTVALQNGANILRVHDVKAAKEAITLLKKLSQNH